MDSRDLFEILVRAHIDSVRSFLLASLRDPLAAEDLVQEAFLVAWRKLDCYDRKMPFGPWVRGIAGKLLLNWRRKQGRSKVHFVDDETLQLMDHRFEEFSSLAGDSFDEHLNALRDCFSCLSPQQRSAIDLHYQHGLHCREIARRLGFGLEAVKKHLQRGRAVLQKCLANKLPSVREEL